MLCSFKHNLFELWCQKYKSANESLIVPISPSIIYNHTKDTKCVVAVILLPNYN